MAPPAAPTCITKRTSAAVYPASCGRATARIACPSVSSTNPTSAGNAAQRATVASKDMRLAHTEQRDMSAAADL
ncbi:hypothetical protein WOLCODRAFT_141192 [Wolfiporia cocos MD-104 SS10]|uniref:Uncharacterized protein n=1 Tax=Wolfiporia cocos (strain MD-104) TaxID=742152 RepID=A0A2H3JCN0_WOLCO|nr:hypothetical protein WOLCODRAFT_141192 [Wolfiporia cocos MD-104 SS10]